MNLPSKIDNFVKYLLVVFSYIFIIPMVFFSFLYLIILCSAPSLGAGILFFSSGMCGYACWTILYDFHSEKEDE
jgi:hypothetical protein